MENVPMLSEPNVPMLSEPNVPMLSEPELLRYLNGEISFETWLKNQNIDYTESQDNNPLASSLKEASESLNFGCKLPDDESTIFSSWGSIFSDKNEKKKKVKKKRISEKIDLAEESQILELKNTLPTAAPAKFFDTPLRSVSFSNVSDYNAEDDSLQGVELKSLMLKLPSVISTSTANKHIKFKKQKDLEQDIFQDLHNFQFRKRTYAVRQKLSEMARLQLGQANMLVAKGDFKQAAEICMDVVKEVPSSGEPFKTLSFIYDEQGNKEMALQYALVSAFLDCKDAQEWRDLAQRCINEGSETQALACYDRACKVLSTDACLQWDRATMYFEKQDYRKTLDILFTIMKIIKPTHLEDFMVIAKEISKLYHKFGLTDRSREMLEVACKMCINIKDYESIHLLSEMYMAIKEYDKLLKLIVKTCDVKLPEDVFKQKNCGINFSEIAAQVSSIQFTDLSSHIVAKLTESSSQIIDQPSNTVDICSKSVESFYVPVELPLDIRVKLAQGLVYLNELNYVESITEPLFSEDLNDVGDLMLDLAESYYETGNYQLALKYLLELVDCAKFNQAAVWLKIAESFDYLNEKEKSIDAYYMVLSLAPQHVSVRMTLASLLRSVGRADEAVTVISEYEVTFNDNSETCVSELSKLKVEECEMLYKKCLKLYDECNYKDFLCDGYILIHNYLLWSFGYQKQMLIGRAQMWQFLLKMLNVAMDLKEHQKAIKLVNKAILFKPYQESRKYRLELDYLQTTIYFVAGEYAKAFESFRILIMHETEEVIDKNTIWNLFALITNKMMDKRHHRYVLRLLFRKPLRVPLIMINGNNSFVSGTYKYAIGEYLRCFREWPTNPLTSLLLAVSYLHLACQKFHKTRHASIIQGLIFMFQYMSLRKENQESHYNMGRAFHQIGLVHFATFYYNKALEFPMHNENDSNKAEYHPFIDLHREAACNLAMIYKASGNIELAKKTLYKYCWV
ncbi:general transcription factor 3C polypeptide 3 isoform X2 [Hydra vulgaris]|uniref:General transcription factor 3C polypeptide 3 isoform X2 n=1 Tax=Hydra vulgaris TaxID=6087 RepID=A0ABM4C6N3_HYDVU